MSPRFGAVVASAAAAATTAVGISFSWDTFSLVSWADFCSGLPVRAREACLFKNKFSFKFLFKGHTVTQEAA